MSEFVTWEMLGTYAGCTAAVAVLTQFIKGLGILTKVPTQILTYVLALILMILSTIFVGEFTVDGILLTVFNAAVVSLASNGGYSAVTRVFDAHEAATSGRGGRAE